MQKGNVVKLEWKKNNSELILILQAFNLPSMTIPTLQCGYARVQHTLEWSLKPLDNRQYFGLKFKHVETKQDALPVAILKRVRKSVTLDFISFSRFGGMMRGVQQSLTYL